MTTQSDQSDQPELKPCPHCGNSAAQMFTSRIDRVSYVTCQDCGARGGVRLGVQLAADTWNARSWNDADLDLIVNRLSELLKEKRR